MEIFKNIMEIYDSISKNNQYKYVDQSIQISGINTN